MESLSATESTATALRFKPRSFARFMFGRHYWAGLIRWIQSRVLSESKISPGDLDLILLTDDPQEAAHAVIQAWEAQNAR